MEKGWSKYREFAISLWGTRAQCILEASGRLPRESMPQSYPNWGGRKLEYLSYGGCIVVWGILQGVLILGQPCTQPAYSCNSKSSERCFVRKQRMPGDCGQGTGHLCCNAQQILTAQNWMEFAESYKKCQMIWRPEIIDFYSPPAETRFQQYLLRQDWMTGGQCRPWKPQWGSFPSNSITHWVFIPRLCYKWSNESIFYAFFFFF